MSEVAVLVNCDGASIMCVEAHPSLNRRSLALVASGTAKAMRQRDFHMHVLNFAEMEFHPPKGMIMLQKSYTEASPTTVNNQWRHRTNPSKLYPYTNTRRVMPNQSARIYRSPGRRIIVLHINERLIFSLMKNSHSGGTHSSTWWTRLRWCGTDTLDEWSSPSTGWI